MVRRWTRGGWGEARIRVTLEEPERADRAAQLLAPLQPFRAAPNLLTFRVVGQSELVRRLLERLDAERIHGTLEVLSSDPVPEREPEAPPPTLRESWEAANQLRGTLIARMRGTAERRLLVGNPQALYGFPTAA